MTTNADVIKGALGLIGVIAETETASAEQADHALAILNDFMEDWLASGVDVGQWPQTDVDDEFPGPSGVVATVKAHLAIHLAPYYQAQVSPVVVAMASSGYARLLRESVVAQMVEQDMTHLPMGAGHTGKYDIMDS